VFAPTITKFLDLLQEGLDANEDRQHG